MAGCGNGQTSLAKLASNQAAYVGEQITTSGVVEAQINQQGTPYYVLADAAQNLVLLVPAARVRRFQGAHVSVRGRFEFDPHRGRLIHVAGIHRS